MGHLVDGPFLNYVDDVQISKNIGALALSLAFAGLSAITSHAAELTADERNVCSNLRVCLDIIKRHDASEFDYAVLESEFQRFGSVGRRALMDVLDSEAGNPEMAEIISRAAPLSPSERQNLKKNWSLDRAEVYLPFLKDGHPFSRDLLLLSLGSDNPAVREQARLALINFPDSAERQPVPQNLVQPLLLALAKDPVAEAAPYLSKLNPLGQEKRFAELLKSGETEVVFGAYEALYRSSRPQAFETLLSEMDRVRTPEQSRAIGDMLLRRHANRADGFYLNFAKEMSGDQARSAQARASGLHAVLSSDTPEMPALTPARAEALRFLVSGQALVTAEKYLPVLRRLEAETELNLIWRVATAEKWVDRDVISEAFEGLQSEDQVIADLIRSDDFRSFSAGAVQAKPRHKMLLTSKLNHPVKDIQVLARKILELPAAPQSSTRCIISKFDANDQLNQMPFFDLAWTKLRNNARVALDRKYLTSAHPSQTGWLAGYKLRKPGAKSIAGGAALLHFDNKTGAFQRIGNFSGPLAILPDRSLKLGQSTNRFWVINQSGEASADISAYSVDLTAEPARIKHLGALPRDARDFSVAPNGDLLMGFGGETQAPIRMSPRGDISAACQPLQAVTAAPAPN